MTPPSEDSSRTGPLLPFSLKIELLDRMLNLEIADDPFYQGLEIQGFDDPQHGTGMVVFLARRVDGKTDVYYEPGLVLDPELYAIGGGLGAWEECTFEVARLAIRPAGIDAEARFTDVDGRLIEVRIGERARRRRMPGFLAPMGAAITTPRALPLVWMSRFDLLRRTGPEPVVRIDGRTASPGRLPAEWLLRRRLIKVASDLVVVNVNPTEDGVTFLAAEDSHGEPTMEPEGLRALTATCDGHSAVLRFDPPFPDLVSTEPGDKAAGDWDIAIDTTPIVAGGWSLSREGREVRLGMDVSDGWHPSGLPLLMRVMTRVVPVFRRWPTTYRWSATLIATDPPTMVTGWERTAGERGESYRRFTQSAR